LSEAGVHIRFLLRGELMIRAMDARAEVGPAPSPTRHAASATPPAHASTTTTAMDSTEESLWPDQPSPLHCDHRFIASNAHRPS
ncbi:hypothetical protein COCVIDRAFT_102421, partial [Bipolaris victoriae FI3]